MAGGFQVDLEALIGASKGVLDLARDFQNTDVKNFLPDQSAAGSTALAKALDEFGDRWNRGIDNLMKDSTEIAGRLGETAVAYIEADRAVAQTFRDLLARLESSGPIG
ncbi:hypothetical protein GCM10009547_35920 [Sporichthya brevicatena]|uniref:Uncharacterized protein n=1 Tax=Sporichthya brevicatena TaxID=171442 RepID=A0ABN1H509_9ACTN